MSIDIQLHSLLFNLYPMPNDSEIFINKHCSHHYNSHDPYDKLRSTKWCVESWFDDRSGRQYKFNMDNNLTSAFRFLCTYIMDYGEFKYDEERGMNVIVPKHSEHYKKTMLIQLEHLHARILKQMGQEYERLVEEHDRLMDIIREC